MPEIRTINGNEVRKSLSVLLREPQDDIQTLNKRAESFEQMLRAQKHDPNCQIIVADQDHIIFSCFLMPHEGGSAFIFISSVADLNLDTIPLALEAVHRLKKSAAEKNLNFLQLMISPDDTHKIAFANRAGFKRAADIHYMYREVNSRIGIFRIPPYVSWQTYNTDNHNVFADIIEKSWQDSLDCPDVDGLRTVEDTIKSYKASGIFTSRCWSLLCVNNEPAGVCLLSPLPSQGSIELTYMGVVPGCRGKSLGRIMLNRALSLSAIDGYKLMTLAVDSNNFYAWNIYKAAGFKDMFVKAAMLCQL